MKPPHEIGVVFLTLPLAPLSTNRKRDYLLTHFQPFLIIISTPNGFLIANTCSTFAVTFFYHKLLNLHHEKIN